MLSLAGKSALVVGAGQGIGRECALTLARAGAAVGAMDLVEDRARAVAHQIEQIGRPASFHVGDVRDASTGPRLVTEFVRAHQSLDILVTVVGGHSAFAPFIPADETSNETIDLVLDLNLRYILFLIRDVLRHMKDSGRGGAIVSIGSVSGVSGSPNHSAYGAAKAGVNQLAKSVSAEYGRFGIRMNVVNPGVIVTDISAPQLADETRSHLSEVIPAQRLGRPADIANAVAFLCSPLSEYVAGQAILVDGGLSSRWPVPFQSKHPSEA